jgi:lactonase family protein with 7-bladed beta-propeller
MKFTRRLATVAATALALGALAIAPASAGSDRHPQQRAQAVFVQTDDPSGNKVISYERRASGLVQRGTYSTGGLGGVLAGSVVDHLASQGSVQLDIPHHLLYVVNAGSDTLTVFSQHGSRLHRIQVVGTAGDFPVSVTTHGHAVYVLNARAGGSIQGYLRLGDHLLRVPWWHRDLGLDAAATPEFTHTPGQVAFTPDGHHLLITTKANTQAIDVFTVSGLGGVSAQPVVTSLPGAVPFAVSFDPHGHVAVALAATNSVATFSLRHNGKLDRIDTAATGQAATCWIVSTGDKTYASNAGSASLSAFRYGPHGALTPIGTFATGPGTVDAAISSNAHYLYVQTGATGHVDTFRIHHDGALSLIGSVAVPDGVGAEGIAAN